jgi:hypothetical protein
MTFVEDSSSQNRFSGSESMNKSQAAVPVDQAAFATGMAVFYCWIVDATSSLPDQLRNKQSIFFDGVLG